MGGWAGSTHTHTHTCTNFTDSDLHKDTQPWTYGFTRHSDINIYSKNTCTNKSRYTSRHIRKPQVQQSRWRDVAEHLPSFSVSPLHLQVTDEVREGSPFFSLYVSVISTSLPWCWAWVFSHGVSPEGRVWNVLKCLMVDSQQWDATVKSYKTLLIYSLFK